MRTSLLIVLLSQAGATPVPGVQMQNGGTPVGQATTLNCTGAGVTCTKSGSTATITVPGGGSGGITIPNCDAGYVLTGDGGALFCTSTIITALSAGPGLPVGSVQYNGDAGGLGGMTSVVTADGAHLTYLPDTAVAASPSAGRTTQDIGWTSGMPEWPYEIDSFFQQPNWAGMTPPLSGLGSLGSWKLVCHLPDQYSGSNLATNFGTNTSTIAFGSTTSWGFDAGTLLGRLEWAVGANTGSGANIWSTMRETTGTLWRGVPSATSGGFKAWERLATLTESTILADGGNPDSASYMFAGWTTCGSTLTTTADSSAILDTIYVGCDSADSNLHVCSNDRTGSATCTDLGANYPCRSGSAGATGPYGYDAFFYEIPGGTSVGWFVKSIDRSFSATGTLTDLPLWQTGYLCYYAARNSGHDAGSASSGSMGIGAECVWQHL